jgi:hypothetical protein
MILETHFVKLKLGKKSSAKGVTFEGKRLLIPRTGLSFLFSSPFPTKGKGLGYNFPLT